MGTVSGSVYTNEYAGIQFTLPDGWTFSTQEELDAIAQDSIDSLKDTNISKLHQRYAELTSVYTMRASSSDSFGSVFIVLERTDIFKQVDNLTTEEFVERARGNFSKVYDAVADSSGEEPYDYELADSTTVEIAGMEFVTLPVSVYEGLFKQTYYYHKLDGRMLEIVVTGDEEYDPEDLIQYFSVIEN